MEEEEEEEEGLMALYFSALDNTLAIEKKRTRDASVGSEGVVEFDCRCQEFILTENCSSTLGCVLCQIFTLPTTGIQQFQTHKAY